MRKRRKLTKKRLQEKHNREQMLKASIDPVTGKKWKSIYEKVLLPYKRR
jgi:hypothetical protein